MSERKAVVLTGGPVIAVIAEMGIDESGVEEMARWVADRRPACLPEQTLKYLGPDYEHSFDFSDLFPHAMTRSGRPLEEVVEDDDVDGAIGDIITGNELLVELAGRKCYDSFGLKAGRKTNAEYIAHTQQGDIPHASIMYHAKMTFFFAGISRRVSHELIRNYVGADRDEEGSPSQESTRYVEHAGRYIAHPGDLEDEDEVAQFGDDMDLNYRLYLSYIKRRVWKFEAKQGKPPTQMDRKRIYEAASARLSHSCETSWIWTTNPIALAKMIRERANAAADLEFQRFAKKLAHVCVKRWPNLFPQPWVLEAAKGAL